MKMKSKLYISDFYRKERIKALFFVLILILKLKVVRFKIKVVSLGLIVVGCKLKFREELISAFIISYFGNSKFGFLIHYLFPR